MILNKIEYFVDIQKKPKKEDLVLDGDAVPTEIEEPKPKVVIAKITLGAYELREEIISLLQKKVGFSTNRELANHIFYGSGNLVPDILFQGGFYTFIGRSTCNVEDEFDEEFGKALAKSRLIEKVHTFKMKKVQEIYDFYKPFMTALEELNNSFSESVDKDKSKVQALISAGQVNYDDDSENETPTEGNSEE